jgi:hypothetical protein
MCKSSPAYFHDGLRFEQRAENGNLALTSDEISPAQPIFVNALGIRIC